MENSKSYPKVSIITITYNAEKTLENTINSVISQNYTNIEYIIIDGGSTDKTIDIIKKYQEKISYWISEPDRGIYDAMNKGIKFAHGEWINFMNSGDKFFDSNVLSKIFNDPISNKYSCVFGNTIFLYNNGKSIEVKYGDRSIHRIMPSCHQSIFCKSDVLKSYPFNLKYKLAADLDFFNNLKNNNHKYKYINTIVSVYDASEGISSINKEKLKTEVKTILNFSSIKIIQNLSFCIIQKIKRFLFLQ